MEYCQFLIGECERIDFNLIHEKELKILMIPWSHKTIMKILQQLISYCIYYVVSRALFIV